MTCLNWSHLEQVSYKEFFIQSFFYETVYRESQMKDIVYEEEKIREEVRVVGCQNGKY